MKTAFSIFIIVVLAIAPVSVARVVIIPGDYDTIQEGIDSCDDGDTVLVKPGVYFENINFNGHNIAVGSFFLTTGNPEYITSTIIDGESSGSVVTFDNGEDSTAVITGFTIRNGQFGTGGGIHCDQSSPTIYSNYIVENSGYYGGGIFCDSSSALIKGNTILGNHSCWGGGIYSIYSENRILSNRIISNSLYD